MVIPKIVVYCHEECPYKVKSALKAHIYATAYKKWLRVCELTDPEMPASSSHQLQPVMVSQTCVAYL